MLMEQTRKQKIAVTAGICALLAALIWTTHYWHFTGFGLYEDDLTTVPNAITMTVAQLINSIKFNFANFPVIDKPLHYSLIYSLSKLGSSIAGLSGIYGIGYLILVANTILFFTLLLRIGNRTFAILGSLFFCLFFADTTQAFITCSFGVQTSLMWFLIAFHLYLGRRPAFAYLILALTLLTYETIFPVFLAAPLISKKWNRNLLRPFITNGTVMAFLLLADYLLRRFAGEKRTSALNIIETLKTSITHMVDGPLVALGTYLYRPIQALKAINLEMAIIMIVVFLVLAFVLLKLINGPGGGVPDFKKVLRPRTFYRELPDEIKSYLQLALAGIVMLILAYPLTLTVRAYAISGRDTRVHFAAVVGASIVCGAVFTAALSFIQNRNYRRLAIGVLALWFSLLVGFGFVVQKDYVQAWDYERAFWSSLLPQIQDIQNGTVILIDPNGLKKTRQIDANTWNLPRILNQIYTFPAEWKKPPRVFLMVPGWEAQLVDQNGLFSLDARTTLAPPSLYTTANSTDAIVFDTQGGKLARLTAPLSISGKIYPIKVPANQAAPAFEKGPLYSLLVNQTP